MVSLLLNEDDSDGSSQPDDDGSDDGETDDHSQEDFTLSEDQLERRTTSGGSQRNNLAPQSMQWAIRSHDPNRSSVRLTGGTGLMFIDPAALRRTTPSSAAVAATQEPPTMSTTASSLARAFGIILRQVCQLFNTVNELYTTGMLHVMSITYQEANELHVSTKYEGCLSEQLYILICLFTDDLGNKIETNLGLDTDCYGRN